MSYRKSLNLGNSIERSHSYEELDQGTDGKLAEGQEVLQILGERFEADKEAFEKQLELVMNSPKVDERVKAEFKADIERKIEALRDEYDAKVTIVHKAIEEKVNENLSEMDEKAEELDSLAEEMRDTVFEVAPDDLSDTAEDLDARKEEFENMREQYAEQLRLQVEQAEQQRRAIQRKTLGN